MVFRGISLDVANAMTLHREAAKQAASERRSALKSLKAPGIAEEETQGALPIPAEFSGAAAWGGRLCRAASSQMSCAINWRRQVRSSRKIWDNRQAATALVNAILLGPWDPSRRVRLRAMAER